MVIFGDSISTRNHGDGGYEALIRDSLGLSCVLNHAVGSSGLSLGTPDNGVSLIEKEGNVPADADLVLVWHGSNDWYWGSLLGAKEDAGADTYWGALNRSVHRIRSVAPDALLVFGNPLYRLERPDSGEQEGGAYETNNKEGLTLYDYARALEEAGRLHGFPVIDLHVQTGIHEGNREQYLEDGVHPNRAGYIKIHRVLHKNLTDLLWMAGFETP